MKEQFIIFSLFFISVSCTREEIHVERDTARSNQTEDVKPPVITLIGKKVDTTYLKVVVLDLTLRQTEEYPKWTPNINEEAYYEPGVTVTDEKDGDITSNIQISGRVNNRVLGTYLITYNAKDAAGNFASAVTRTVHVVESSAHFLNGTYNVVCHCTLTTETQTQSTLVTNTYTSSITTSAIRNNKFNISDLNIGSEKRSLSVVIETNSLFPDSYFSPVDYHQGSTLSGTVASSIKTFTIKSLVQTWTPSVRYKCRNVYTKIEN